MSVPESLAKLVGNWTGTSRLWRPWLSPAESDSPSTASVALAAQGKFVTIEYTWAVDGEPQGGLLLLGYERERQAIQAVWIDSWHMSDRFMLCRGGGDGKGVIALQGSYPAPPGPDWGWRTVIEPEGEDAFRLVMYNISPEGKEALAVEAAYARQP